MAQDIGEAAWDFIKRYSTPGMAGQAAGAARMGLDNAFNSTGGYGAQLDAAQTQPQGSWPASAPASTAPAASGGGPAVSAQQQALNSIMGNYGGGSTPPGATPVTPQTSARLRVPAPSTDAYAQGGVVAPSIAGGAPQSGPATAAAAAPNMDARIRDALMKMQMGYGDLGTQEQNAAATSERGKYIGDLAANVKKNDTFSNLSRAASIAGRAYLDKKAGEERTEIGRQQKDIGFKTRREIEQLRKGEDWSDPRQSTWEL